MLYYRYRLQHSLWHPDNIEVSLIVHLKLYSHEIENNIPYIRAVIVNTLGHIHSGNQNMHRWNEISPHSIIRTRWLWQSYYDDNISIKTLHHIKTCVFFHSIPLGWSDYNNYGISHQFREWNVSHTNAILSHEIKSPNVYSKYRMCVSYSIVFSNWCWTLIWLK